jgi:methionine synthase II (cobalamin-independent)
VAASAIFLLLKRTGHPCYNRVNSWGKEPSTMTHEFDCIATGIGSLPLTDPDEAVALVLRYLPEAPFWPQLPKRGFQEHMGGQYSEALPGIIRDAARERFSFDTSHDLLPELERFFERYLERDYDFFGLSADFAAGFPALLRALGKAPASRRRFLKGHVTGPLTAGISYKDHQGRDIIHDEQLFDAVVKKLAMNAGWQIRQLGAFGKPVIIFLDEPAMETLGSAFSPAAPELVAEKLDEVIATIHECGGIAGIHCCGNADWPLIFNTKVDIVNFDAFDYLERVLLYPAEIRALFARGGALAWGIVPTSTGTGAETADSLTARLEEGIRRLEAAGIPRRTILRQSLITPSCGLGSLSRERAEAILKLTLEISERMQARLP